MDRRRELIDKARETARRLGKTGLTLEEFKRGARVSKRAIYTHFESWPELCRHAGLEAAGANVRISDEALFWAMHDAFVELGGIVSRKAFNRCFRYGLGVFRRRNMTWTDALKAFRAWAGKNAPEFPYLDQLPDGAARPGRYARPRGRRVLGDSVNFRALQHAPVNEHGVMVLFGMVAADLGFLVESVAPGFPDCEAKRLIGPRRWERVRIEFEYRSRSFREHGHDPGKCDLIVCWEDNWPDCPIQVLALSDAIRTLPGGADG